MAIKEERMIYVKIAMVRVTSNGALDAGGVLISMNKVGTILLFLFRARYLLIGVGVAERFLSEMMFTLLFVGVLLWLAFQVLGIILEKEPAYE